MQINSTCSNQSFGAIKYTPYVDKVIRGRIKTKSGIAKFEKLVESQKNNPVDTYITSVDSRFMGKPDMLSAHFDYKVDGVVHRESLSEYNQNLFEKLISSPIRFLKKVCARADEIAKSNGIER